MAVGPIKSTRSNFKLITNDHLFDIRNTNILNNVPSMQEQWFAFFKILLKQLYKLILPSLLTQIFKHNRSIILNIKLLLIFLAYSIYYIFVAI